MISVARLVSLLTLAASLPISEAKELDVWAPPIKLPDKHTIWHRGEHYYVVWDAASAPTNITHPTGKIYLEHEGQIDLSNPLAEDFKLTDGRVLIQAPDVKPGKYKVVVYGDSGNDSELFKIE